MSLSASPSSHIQQRTGLRCEPSAPTERLLPLALGYRAHLCFQGVEVQVATVRLGRPRRLEKEQPVVKVSTGMSG